MSLKWFLVVLLLLRCLPREADLASRAQVLMLLCRMPMLLGGHVVGLESIVSYASSVCLLCMHVLLAECK